MIKTELSTADLNYIIFMVNRYKELSHIGFTSRETEDHEYIVDELYKLQEQLA